MAIYRIKRHDRNFTVLGNDALRDARLSFRARGVLAYILSLPPDAKFPATKLADQQTVEGATAIRTAFKELEAAGYLVRRRYQDEKGQWGQEITCYEVPPTADLVQSVAETVIDAPSEGCPHSVDTDLKSKNVDSKDSKRNTLAPTAQTGLAKVLTPQQQLMEALVEACEWDRNEITPKKWTSIAVAAADLNALPQPPNPDEVVRRGYNYRINHPEWARTPWALVTHWADSAEVHTRFSDRDVREAMDRERWRNA